jgi:hypothetical protein
MGLVDAPAIGRACTRRWRDAVRSSAPHDEPDLRIAYTILALFPGR